MVRIRESWDKKIRTRRRNSCNLNLETADQLHDLVLGDTASRLSAFHHVPGTTAGVQVLDEGDAQRTTTVLVTGEFG